MKKTKNIKDDIPIANININTNDYQYYEYAYLKRETKKINVDECMWVEIVMHIIA